MDTDAHAILLNEIRYAERLCQRTARLYRHAQAAATALGVMGGSAAAAALSTSVPKWVSLVGLVLLAVVGAVALAVRPVEKAVANELDAKRYAQLRAAARNMDSVALQAALDKAREPDAAEVETLRDVAYNDLVREVGRPELAVKLTTSQRLLAALA